MFHAAPEGEDLTLYTLSNLEAVPFAAEEMKAFTTHGITFTLDVPRVATGPRAFDSMIALAKQVGQPGETAKEMMVQSSDQTQQTIRGSTAMIQNPEGKIVGIMSMLNDIAKQKELQRIQFLLFSAYPQ